MREPLAVRDPRHRVMRIWLWSIAALILAMVLVGGATRLTESGLSITEWQPVTGTLPPMSDAAWTAAFEKYKAIPQYQQVNRGMSLAEFKTIFWWEWAHRLLGRLIGVAFLLTLACLIYVAVLWAAERLDGGEPVAVNTRLRATAVGLVVLVLAQIYLGALVAGLRAGLVYHTWPTIDGALVPAGARLFFEQPLWRNFFENALTVQFQHRMTGYAVWLVALWHWLDVLRSRRKGPLTGALLLAVAVTLQAALGILTLI